MLSSGEYKFLAKSVEIWFADELLHTLFKESLARFDAR